MCSFQGLQPIHFTCGLHPSSVDALVDVHDPSYNFPFFHHREALLVGHWVTTLPSFSCSILFPSPPEEVAPIHGTYFSVVVPFLLACFCGQLGLCLPQGTPQSVSHRSYIHIHIPGGGISCGGLIAANGGKDKVDQEPRPSFKH